jgi:cell filamentation protein
MANHKNKYYTDGLTEAEFEPGSRGLVLKNLVGIKSRRIIEKEETIALLKTEEWATGFFSREHRFTEADIRKTHKVFLGKIYSWAGNYRNVNISKGDFPFAFAREIPRLMDDFSRNILAEYAPCNYKEKNKTVKAIAVTHAELLLIHPFREGNGRFARLLANLMTFQAGWLSLDFGFIKKKTMVSYYRAIQQALDKNYAPMIKLIGKVV